MNKSDADILNSLTDNSNQTSNQFTDEMFLQKVMQRVKRKKRVRMIALSTVTFVCIALLTWINYAADSNWLDQTTLLDHKSDLSLLSLCLLFLGLISFLEDA